ncbi:Lsr2 family protein [Strepomyces sp. STD 3.1]|nr:Lsr2 family protein [Streptomyces sp. STD 3.1]
MTIAALRRLLDDAAKTAERRASAADDRRSMRAWAAENGISCSPHGPIPAIVQAAWRAAQTDTDGATP